MPYSVLSIRDGLLPPLTKISSQPKYNLVRYFTGEHFGLDLIVFITCENKHAVLLVQALFNTESRQGQRFASDNLVFATLYIMIIAI